MEKVIFYKVYYFENLKTKEKYYFENEHNAQVARFAAYKTYDRERLSIRHFVVPVSEVKSILINEKEINQISLLDNPHAENEMSS